MLMKEWVNGFWAPDEGGGATAGWAPVKNRAGVTEEGPSPDPIPSTGEGNDEPATFESWLEGQNDRIKALYDGHTRGLKSALEAERAQNRELARQAREAASKAEAGSAAQKAYLELQGKYEALEKRSAFLDEAARPETGCADGQLAYLAALEMGAISEKGKTDWVALKERYPLLFKGRVGNASAGSGTQGAPGSKVTMDQYIRGKAGIS